MVEHIHHAGCGCAEEHKYQDPNGNDLFGHIEMDQVDCFNEKSHGSIRRVIRPFKDKLVQGAETQSGYGKDLVIYVPFSGEFRIKAICVIGGQEGTAPSKMKLYKDVAAVDINILEEKKPIQVIDMIENVTGELEYLVNISKFNNVSNLVIGFDENFGAPSTVVNFIGFKGDKLREKVKVVQTVYEVQANVADIHKTRGDEKQVGQGMGF